MTIKEILRAVSIEHGVSVDEMKGPRRFARIVTARRAAILALRNRGLSLNRIAMTLDKDESTIEYHVYPTRKARDATSSFRATMRSPMKQVQG